MGACAPWRASGALTSATAGRGVRSAGNSKAGAGRPASALGRRVRDRRGWGAAASQAGALAAAVASRSLMFGRAAEVRRRRFRRRSWRRWHPAGRWAGAGGGRGRPRSPRLPPELACRCDRRGDHSARASRRRPTLAVTCRVQTARATIGRSWQPPVLAVMRLFSF